MNGTAELVDRLRALSRDQFGLLTTTQVQAAGVTDDQIRELVATENMWESADGLWAIGGPDLLLVEDWAGIWLTLDLDTPISERRHHPDTIVSHETAAVLRGLGSVAGYQFTLTSPKPIERELPNTRVVVADFDYSEWSLVDGFPVASPARIIADLTADRIDGSHVGTVLETILIDELLTREQVADLIAPHTWQWTNTLAPDQVIDLLITASDRNA
ncbi:hypothetical protein GII30_00625 [Gordonia amarae]|uniref:Uncharacterized protein n=1 Tax=Gordonia amarae TaxID=36821 RepID=A0A857KE08_9ACTN|nr:type IV toxin-antitoxin system AbiEi family antitoxin domain-containing protein [Gordonia amarae]MCS3876843.1 hypothetical protein [Gordonia amarae]QHN15681.1 hypothetical protein GII35_00625 [Gordonia amarae]QHN20250.1 hypothetical protein GII34_00625 [Gordonia amarae]QHN29101.1 hypothetical protein GII32_00625 [Gordonia amarae]QHN37881.1 hypothetical protein GII30_00625 [Gordonia amarae]